MLSLRVGQKFTTGMLTLSLLTLSLLLSHITYLKYVKFELKFEPTEKQYAVIVDEKHNNNIDIDIGFTYDRERWDEISPKIVILLGPHKTGSSTVQLFMSTIAGVTVPVLVNGNPIRKSHPKITNWVWPLGVTSEFRGNSSLAIGMKYKSKAKFYAPLAYLIGGLESKGMFDDWNYVESNPTQVDRYFKALFQRPWKEGKNIVFGSEAFSSFLRNLKKESAGTVGEAIHVAPESSDRIDRLLGLLPWGDSNNDTTKSSSPVSSSRHRSLRLEDIEVQVTYRTPRTSHIESLWHQVGGKNTLREWIEKSNFGAHMHTTNSLALALQFARKGIKTTIVNLAGVLEKEVFNKNITRGLPNKKITGGLSGVIACDVLKMGSEDNSTYGLCDDQSRIHIPDTGIKNIKKDQAKKNMEVKQLDKINRAYEEYDCGVWRHLQKYQAQGSLRMLYPTKDLFATCNTPDEIRGDIPFGQLLETVRSIASEVH